DDILELIAAGRRIEAIKLYRERYGAGLKVAKDAVDAMAAGQQPPGGFASAPPALAADADLRRAIDAELRAGRQINAVRFYRERYGVSLQEAMDAVEAMATGRRAPGRAVTPAGSWELDAVVREQIEAELRAGRRI